MSLPQGQQQQSQTLIQQLTLQPQAQQSLSLQQKQQIQSLLSQNQQKKLSRISLLIPIKLITPHWMTISRPQYQRTCGISSLVSLWNYQFSKLGLGNKQPISIEQAMLKLNLIGNGSIQQNMRKKFKNTKQLTEKVVVQANNNNTNNNTSSLNITQLSSQIKQTKQPLLQQTQIRNSKLSLHEYINTIDFGCFTGNDTLLKWYRLLCRIYGGSGRSYMFYKTNSERSLYKDQQSAKKAIVEGLNSNGKICFIYHAYDHYFCPVGYEIVKKNNKQDKQYDNQQDVQQTMIKLDQLNQQDNQLYIMIGQSSKMFPCMHVVKWTDIQLDLNTYWPKFFNIRRRKQGVQFHKGKENQKSRIDTIDCIMAFQKLKD